jgi:uncharacterized protein
MEIKIQEIPPEGLLLSYDEDPKQWDLSERGFTMNDPVHVRVKAIKHNQEEIYVRGALSAEVIGECSRCLKRFTSQIESDFHAEYVPRKAVPTEGEKELLEEDLDLLFYEGDTIDISEEVEGQLILATPMRPLCSEECRGLCPQCGQDLNLKQCACVQEIPDPRWAELKKFTEKKSSPK